MADAQRGLYDKYVVTHRDGSPVDPEAFYLVLRLDKGLYVDACRRAADEFAEIVRDDNPQLADDLIEIIARYDYLYPR